MWMLRESKKWTQNESVRPYRGFSLTHAKPTLNLKPTIKNKKHEPDLDL